MPTLRITRKLLPAAIAALVLTPLAVAASPDCDASGATLNCKLQGFLSFLYDAAGVLAVVLLIVVVVAALIYRKNKNSRDLP